MRDRHSQPEAHPQPEPDQSIASHAMTDEPHRTAESTHRSDRRPRLGSVIWSAAVGGGALALLATVAVVVSGDRIAGAESESGSTDQAPTAETAPESEADSEPSGSEPVDGDTDGATADPVVDTVTVEVRDLVETTRLNGTLGYDEPLAVMNRVRGTVTTAPRAGAEVQRGDELYRIDNEPVFALYGEVGAWRELSADSSQGADIRQLEENLSALGYDPDAKLVIDDTWDAATTAAVKRWQVDVGIDDDGVIGLGQVIFIPGAGQITRVEVARGMGVDDGVEALRYQPYADTDTVVGTQEGNVTNLAPVGAPIGAGDVLVEVNTNPTYALLGDNVVNDRTLKKGVTDGTDIEALEANLTAMGHDPDGDIEVDRKWDDATTDAVNRWLASLDLDEDGKTTPELFQFVEPDSMVIGHIAAIGDEVDDPTAILETGRSLREVNANMPAGDQELVAVGDTVEIILPDGATSPGIVSEIASTATESGSGESTIALGIEPQDPAGLGNLVEAPIRVEVEQRRTDAVLAVPTASLVGLIGGGHAVEVQVPSGGTQLVAVELGETADGWIQITAGQLSEGDQVVIPR